MSYHYNKTNDLTNDYFVKSADFLNILPNLLKAKTKEEFVLWKDKLEQVDRRSLVLYIKNNINKIPIKFVPEISKYIRNLRF